MFAFVVEGVVNSLIVRKTAKGSEMLTVGVRFEQGKTGVAWTTAWASQFSYEGALLEGGKPEAVVVEGESLKVGTRVVVRGTVGGYEKDGKVQRGFNLTGVTVKDEVPVLEGAEF